MLQRTVPRFRRRVILLHWVQAASSAVLLVTGTIMFSGLTSMNGGREVRAVHEVAAGLFVAVPVLFSLADPRAALGFVREAFRWGRADLDWLKASPGYYSGLRRQMPAQGYLNGDQRLWQLVTVVGGMVLALSGAAMWFFKLKMPMPLYQWLLLTHEATFVVVSFMFLVHFYLATLHPRHDESLGSMLDGMISPAYAREHYGEWYDGQSDARGPEATVKS